MTVADDYAKLAKLRRRQNDLERRIRTAKAELDQLDQRIRNAEYVTEIYDGVALHVEATEGWRDVERGKHPWTNIGEVGGNRHAKIYLNQHNYTTYGIHLYDYSFHAYMDHGKREQWLGSNFTSYDECVKIAKEWCANGINLMEVLATLTKDHRQRRTKASKP